MIFGSGGDVPARYRAAGEGIETTLMCRVEHLHRLVNADGNTRVVAIRREASAEECVELARAVHLVHPVTRISTFGEHDQDRAALVGEALGLATYPVETVTLVTDKGAMRQRLADTGVDETPAVMVDSLDELLEFAAKCGYPIVVKPAAGTASFGVSVVSDDSELSAAYERATAEHDGVNPLGVVAEQFHDGPQYSVEAFSEAGEHVVAAITRKYSAPETLVEVGHVLPAPLDEQVAGEIADYLKRALDALGVRFGPTHTELVLTKTGPRIIETHIRCGGDDLYELVKDAVGVDLIDLQIRQTLGERVLPSMRQALAERAETARCEAIWFAVPPPTGELVEVLDTELPAEWGEQVVLKVLAVPGRALSGLQSSYSRLAQARAHAGTAAEALALAQQAIGRLTFVCKVPSAIPDIV